MKSKKFLIVVLVFGVLIIGSAGFATYAQESENGAEMDAPQEESAIATEQEGVSDLESENELNDSQIDFPEETAISDPSEATLLLDEGEEAGFAAMENGAEEQIVAESQQEAEHLPERTVNITTSRDTDTLQLGSCITLTANLEGYDGVDYTCQWQYATADSEGNIVGEWQDAEETGLTLSYILTEQNILTAWRMRVIVAE